MKPQASSPKSTVFFPDGDCPRTLPGRFAHLHLTIGIRSRTTAAHSLLSALTPDEREQVSVAMVKAMDQIEKIVRSHLVATGRSGSPPPVWYIPASFVPGGTLMKLRFYTLVLMTAVGLSGLSAHAVRASGPPPQPRRRIA